MALWAHRSTLYHLGFQDPSRLLAERGFTREGLAHAEEQATKSKPLIDTGAARPTTPPEEPRLATAAAEPETDAPATLEAQRAAPLRRVSMLDEIGKAHPMVQAARNQQREPEVRFEVDGGSEGEKERRRDTCPVTPLLLSYGLSSAGCRTCKSTDRQSH
jgi:hypothetical protein